MVKKGREHWVDGDSCTACSVVLGFVVNRKVFCRRCGKVFCEKCCAVKCPVVSESRMAEEGYKVKEKTVCNCCWENWLDSPKTDYLVGRRLTKLDELGVEEERDGWVRYHDAKKNRIYEYNKETRQTRWFTSEADVSLISTNRDPDCAICLAPLKQRITQFHTGHIRTCRHAFHPCCASALTHKHCPVCRVPFSYIKCTPNPTLQEAPYFVGYS
eukprot:TRINITY_DN4631_c0_g2_i1.p2 TRINITY_DN4631_c0_g2~~TRINITY_DN4631_c0_g2_i1.p2  ORF type:complete len:229 (+),score=50.50 TRINITY_DN4631_c0_g2_i1:48-689(+)